MNFLSGFKTVLVGIATAIAPAALSYVGGIDPVKVFGLSPTAGAFMGMVMIGLRAITNSGIFSSVIAPKA